MPAIFAATMGALFFGVSVSRKKLQEDSNGARGRSFKSKTNVSCTKLSTWLFRRGATKLELFAQVCICAGKLRAQLHEVSHPYTLLYIIVFMMGMI